ncbi:hypothetical protein JOF56_010014 [Kibdelosporangium banguiense]|uniref:Uncharacterized protein n=1 Tax=Kibdelosporangium banguiense TaxID=1365924 RepID=A0ABS4TYY8_9PSEU|nr:hypothetical protein [Kibdelosporangium banguiense]MBP2329629.1 hypothetical protein [Kibdelosporangium banguiense]
MNLIVLLVAIGVGFIAVGTCLVVFADEIENVVVTTFLTGI